MGCAATCRLLVLARRSAARGRRKRTYLTRGSSSSGSHCKIGDLRAIEAMEAVDHELECLHERKMERRRVGEKEGKLVIDVAGDAQQR
jgi:hypothetical protein